MPGKLPTHPNPLIKVIGRPNVIPCHTSTIALICLAPYTFLAVELVTALGTTPQTMPEFGV